MATIFERYGGFSGIRRIVSDFYDRVLDDTVLARHFEGIDLPALIDHQTKFIMTITGGPANTPNEQLRRAHARLGVTPTEFRRIVGILEETLEDHNMQPEDVAAVIQEVNDREAYVVSKADGS